MRSAADIKGLILTIAGQDVRVRAVLLNGSLANPKVAPDLLQDFDVVFIVNQLETFITDPFWTDMFGKKIIYQLPDEMTFGKEPNDKRKTGFAYLMLLEDKNRVDLTLFPLNKIETDFNRDSLTELWLDKDHLFTSIPPSSDQDYWVIKPTEKEFLDTCNEFWWVSTYVAKGLFRKDIMYAKQNMETTVRPMFMKIIEWKVGIENNFTVSIGKSGKFLPSYLSEDLYQDILHTYANFEIHKNWNALLLMADLFARASHFVSERLGFRIDNVQQEQVMAYLHETFERIASGDLK